MGGQDIYLWMVLEDMDFKLNLAIKSLSTNSTWILSIYKLFFVIPDNLMVLFMMSFELPVNSESIKANLADVLFGRRV
jgi:hypothetical protein